MIYKGTKGDDDLLGTDADDLFVPLIGHDAVQAGAGFDTLRIDYSRFASSKWDSTIIIEADGTMGGVISGAGRNWVEYQGIEALDLTLTAGDDTVYVSNEANLGERRIRLDGGAGVDTLEYGGLPGDSPLRLIVAEDGSISSNIFSLTSFEKFWMSLGDGADVIQTGAANDTIYGGRGSDTLAGGAGDDLIEGGVGADIMTGGAGADQFRMYSLAEFSHRADVTDIITDFDATEGDSIDLSKIDPDKLLKGNQAFTFIGEETFNSGSPDYQLRITARGDNLYTVEADTNHDAVADFSFDVVSQHGIAATDFLL
jgi:serralysin